ncbi:TetR/AcrR family transcriptional regulator [Gordonia sputi]
MTSAPTTAQGRPRRQQARAKDTREQILKAAAKVLYEEGFSAATTLHIQQVAGVSRGRLLHHFPSRAELLSAAVHHIGVERMQYLFSDLDFPDDPRERIAVAIDAMWRNTQEPYFWASMELWLGARSSDGDITEALSTVEHQMGSFVRAQTDFLFGTDLAERPGYVQAREIMLTSMRGAALAYSFNHKDPQYDSHLKHWQWMFEQLLDD